MEVKTYRNNEGIEMKDKPLITVAVAIYNEKNEYLKECIDSIIAQTYDNLEILLIGDHTNDENLILMRKYEARDIRVRVIQNEVNKKLSAVRNIGFQNASGDYISFVDSDDWMEPGIIEKVISRCQAYGYPDMAVWTFNLARDGNKAHTNYKGPKERLLMGDEVRILQYQVLDPTIQNEWIQLPMFVTAWAKLYKMSFIRAHPDIRFFEEMVRGAEDYPFNFRIFREAKSALVLGEYGYNYRRHTGSITQSMGVIRWERRHEWMDAIYGVINRKSAGEMGAFCRFCLDQTLGQIAYLEHPASEASNYRDKKKVLAGLREDKYVKDSLSHLATLEYKSSKRIFFESFKHGFDFFTLIGAKVVFHGLDER